ncbi:MAG TPA: hypothetical protein VD999_07905 [Vitreimonas sp.]|nr:hypothetical protein [Vitreimonas sp.]
MRLVPYEVKHLDEIMVVEMDNLKEIANISPKELMIMTADKSLCMTAVDDDDQVVFIIGLNQLWGKVYEAWLLISPLIQLYKKSSIRLMKQLKAQLVNSIGFQRVQADIRADLQTNIEFVKYFGFKFEGAMLKYGVNGETYLRYSIVGD